MSSTERVRAWRAAQRAAKAQAETKPETEPSATKAETEPPPGGATKPETEAQPAGETEPATKPAGSPDPDLAREVEALRARIAELTDGSQGGIVKEWRDALTRNRQLKKELDASRAATGLGADAEAAVAQAVRLRDEARTKLARAEALLDNDEGEVGKLRKLLRGAQTKATNANRALQRRPATISRGDWNTLQKALGGNASEETRARAHQIFNDLNLPIYD